MMNIVSIGKIKIGDCKAYYEKIFIEALRERGLLNK
ncbi:hypothetical protein THOM_1282 [Trachipleistophora hominis]|uniref:Uncharacterized protein n=1 Tax=Trachipleistophora hominis TaxID=72359 RepID=L7JWG4_TRAHO|nr:hypothetical protein THOM_1282 [Trachipleistophora hominis]